MVKRIIFWRAEGCYKSALAILEAMEHKVGQREIFIRKLHNSKVKPHKDDYIINWGNGGYNSWEDLEGTFKQDVHISNNPKSVHIGCNKIKTFKALDDYGVQTLKWTTNKARAQEWSDTEHTIIVRHTVSGCCGEGIEIIEPSGVVPDAPLYTLYQKKRHEYRVHVFKDQVIDVVQKKKKKGSDSPTGGKIRNVDDGWAFCHNNLQINNLDALNKIGIDAVKACGLDFGAVDVIWNESQDKYYVVEVNTAPGLETSTIQCYADAFLKDIENV